VRARVRARVRACVRAWIVACVRGKGCCADNRLQNPPTIHTYTQTRTHTYTHHTNADTLPTGSYYRFSPEGAAFAVEIDQTDKGKIGELQSATHEYISLQNSHFAALAQRLRLD